MADAVRFGEGDVKEVKPCNMCGADVEVTVEAVERAQAFNAMLRRRYVQPVGDTWHVVDPGTGHRSVHQTKVEAVRECEPLGYSDISRCIECRAKVKADADEQAVRSMRRSAETWRRYLEGDISKAALLASVDDKKFYQDLVDEIEKKKGRTKSTSEAGF